MNTLQFQNCDAQRIGAHYNIFKEFALFENTIYKVQIFLSLIFSVTKRHAAYY